MDAMTPSKTKGMMEAFKSLVTAGPQNCMPILIAMAEKHPDTLLQIMGIVDEAAWQELEDLVLDKQFVAAMKLYRSLKGCDLLEAKEAVAAMRKVIEAGELDESKDGDKMEKEEDDYMVCPDCGGMMVWCRSCLVWSQVCCVDDGTCECS